MRIIDKIGGRNRIVSSFNGFERADRTDGSIDWTVARVQKAKTVAKYGKQLHWTHPDADPRAFCAPAVSPAAYSDEYGVIHVTGDEAAWYLGRGYPPLRLSKLAPHLSALAIEGRDQVYVDELLRLLAGGR